MAHRTIRLAIAATASVGLVTAGVASAAPGGHSAARTKAVAVVPSYKAVIKKVKKSSKLTLFGPTSINEGLVSISLKSEKGDFEVAAISFKSGYSLKKFDADVEAFGASYNSMGQPSKAGLRHLRNAIKHSYLYGGLDATAGHPDSGEFLLDHPGTVYIYNDSGELPADVHKISVAKSATVEALPPTTATVTMKTSKRFGGSKTLPAKGTIEVKNNSTESPHFLDMSHVKNGTTRKEVLEYLESGKQGNPPFELPGETGTDSIGEGVAQDLTYNLPAGEYVQLCFFPDPQTGMPHALMGMIGIVHLK